MHSVFESTIAGNKLSNDMQSATAVSTVHTHLSLSDTFNGTHVSLLKTKMSPLRGPRPPDAT